MNFKLSAFFIYPVILMMSMNIMAQGIHEAAEEGNLESVKKLLAEDPGKLHDNSGAEDRYPLHCAIRAKQVSVAKYLIEKGADVNAKDIHGSSVLNYASYWELVDIVKLLIGKGAEVENDRNNMGLVPLHFVAIRGNREIARMLIENGADINAGQDVLGTPLHMARTADMVTWLVENGAEIDARDNDLGLTPLLRAVRKGNMEIVRLLVSIEADVTARLNDGRSILHLAVENGETGMVDLVLDLVDDKDVIETNYGMTPLHRAAIQGYSEVVKRLLEEDSNVDAKDNKGRTPLYYAGKYGHKTVAGILEAHGGTTGEVEENYGPSSLLKEKINEQEAFIWYLGHSGWAVKTKNKLLIFDYYEYGDEPLEPHLANGHIDPVEIKDFDVCVFVSHAHWDHFDSVVLDWNSTVKDIQYIFSWKAMDDPDYVYMDAYRDVKRLNGMEISKIDSELEDEGAFCVRVDGLTIYHGGDYYFTEDDGGDMAYLAGKHGKVDIAFIESGFQYICLHTIEKLKPILMFPMHARNNEIQYKRFAEEASQKFSGTRFVCVENRGDMFVYKRGGVE